MRELTISISEEERTISSNESNTCLTPIRQQIATKPIIIPLSQKSFSPHKILNIHRVHYPYCFEILFLHLI